VQGNGHITRRQFPFPLPPHIYNENGRRNRLAVCHASPVEKETHNCRISEFMNRHIADLEPVKAGRLRLLFPHFARYRLVLFRRSNLKIIGDEAFQRFCILVLFGLDDGILQPLVSDHSACRGLDSATAGLAPRRWLILSDRTDSAQQHRNQNCLHRRLPRFRYLTVRRPKKECRSRKSNGFPLLEVF
jgi:hypothetical protein